MSYYRLNLISFFAICAMLLFLIYANNTIKSNNDYTKHEQYIETAQYNVSDEIEETVEIDEILNRERERIKIDMNNFDYPAGLYNISAKNLSDLTLETGGNPYRSLIITTWRTGSTFLGEIVNTMPSNFYHYEPLLNYEIQQIRGPPFDKKAIQKVKQFLTCNYTNMHSYLEYGKIFEFQFEYNVHLWNQCNLYPQYCRDPKFLEPFCKLFPLQSMKLVRLRLHLAEQLLEDKQLNVRIILLVRDPRGIMRSRKSIVWCPFSSDCNDPQTLCNDMTADYHAAVNLRKKYPQRLRITRYEDLSLNPYEMGKDILRFYGLPFEKTMVSFLQSHTKIHAGDEYTTYRDSKSAPFLWIKELKPNEVVNIEQKCSEAMSLYGYKKSNNGKFDSIFNPLLPFSFS